MGVAIRDAKGDPLTLRAKSRSLCSPLQAVCEAVLLDLHMAMAMQVKKLIVREIHR